MGFVEKLRKAIQAKGLKQSAVERAALLAENRIAKWGSDQGEPTARQALRLARVLNVSFEALVDDDVPEEQLFSRPGAHQLTDDEAFILGLVRDLGLDRQAAVRALSAAASQPGAARPIHPDAGKQLALHDLTESRIRRDEEERRKQREGAKGKGGKKGAEK